MELVTKQNGMITRDNVVELLNVSTSQAYRLLKKLTEKGKLELVGSGRKAFYAIKNKHTETHENARVCFCVLNKIKLLHVKIYALRKHFGAVIRNTTH